MWSSPPEYLQQGQSNGSSVTYRNRVRGSVKGGVLRLLSRLLNTSPVLGSLVTLGNSLCPREPQMKASESKELMSVEKLVHKPAALSLRKRCCCPKGLFLSQSSSEVAAMAAQLWEYTKDCHFAL